MSALTVHQRALWLLSLLLTVGALALDWNQLQPEGQAPMTQLATIAMTRVESAPPPLPPPRAAQRAIALRVLFVGNSLTETNDMPGMVGKLAQAAGEERSFDAQTELVGGASLRDHLKFGRVAARLTDGTHWDAVVLQEQGQTAGFEGERRERWFSAPMRELHGVIAATGTKPVFFVTYARREGDISYVDDNYTKMQQRVIDGNAALARELGVDQVPVGVIWRDLVESRPALRLWATDGLHPSVAGSYLAACAFYAYFFGKSPIGNPFIAALDPADARAIQIAVDARMIKPPHTP